MELKELIKNLSNASGVTGLDNAVNIAEKELRLLGETERDRMGGIAAKIKGQKDYTILLDAHIDEIGMLVTEIDCDFIRVAKCGGIDARVLISQEVVIHGKQDIFGVFCSVPPHIKSEKNTVPEPFVPLMTGSSSKCSAARASTGSAGMPQKPSPESPRRALHLRGQRLQINSDIK